MSLYNKFISNQPYILIPICLDRDGNGPVCDGTHVSQVYEVWDDVYVTKFSSKYKFLTFLSFFFLIAVYKLSK